jgi:hypothetical protein
MSILQSLNINFIYIDEVLNQKVLQTSDIYFILQLEQEITRLERLLELPIEPYPKMTPGAVNFYQKVNEICVHKLSPIITVLCAA